MSKNANCLSRDLEDELAYLAVRMIREMQRRNPDVTIRVAKITRQIKHDYNWFVQINRLIKEGPGNIGTS